MVLGFLMPACCALAAFCFSSWASIGATSPDLLVTAGDLRSLCDRLTSYAHAIQVGQMEDREPLAQSVATFDQTLDLLEHGGRMHDRTIAPAPTEIQDEIARARQVWQAVKPSLLVVASSARDDARARDAYAFLQHTLPGLSDASNEIVVATESRNQALGKQSVLFLIAFAAFGLGLILAGTWVVSRHLSAREQAEGQWKESEQRFQSLANSTPDAVVIRDDHGNIVSWNHSAERIFGYPADEAIGKPIDMLVAPESAAAYQRFARQLAETGTSDLVGKPVHMTGVRKGGSAFVIEISIATWVAGSRSFSGAIIRDVDEQERAREERNRLARAVEQASEAIIVAEPDARLAYVNPAFERMTGYDRDEVLGQNPRLLQSGKQDKAFYARLWATLLRGESWSGTFINRRKDGREYEVKAVISPVRDESGATVNYVAVERDVTQERQLETQLMQAQKMEAVGRLAGGVAHDFNNLLTVIMGYAQLMRPKLGPDHRAVPDAEEILKAAARAATLTRQLLAFSRQQVLEVKVFNPNSVIADADKLLRRLIGEDIEVVTATSSDLGQIKADPGQIGQVLMNLAVNARDAMPNGGKLVIETANVTLDDECVREHVGLSPGQYVMLSVSDSGCGMSSETKARIFEPFFTTKGVGKGTGLGLATVHGIIKQSGGCIEVYSELGQGTTFKMFLPRVDDRSHEAPGQSGSGEEDRGTETVLLVEDEDAIRHVIRQSLERCGYHVIEAADGLEAIRLCEQGHERVDLLLTDVVMPVMNGAELAHRLASIKTGFRTLFISGYTDRALVHQGLRNRGTAFLQKPFVPEVLTRKVRQVLDEPLRDAA